MKVSKKPHHHAHEECARPLSPPKVGRYKKTSLISPQLAGEGDRRASLRGGGGVSYFFALILLFIVPLPAHADQVADNRRAEALFTEVRCVQCQSESIADSNAQIANDMRNLIRADIKAGKTNAEIRKSLYDHYGDYVLFRPRLTKGNLLLWFSPLLIVLLGGCVLWRLNKNQDKSNSYELSAEEDKKLRDLMK